MHRSLFVLLLPFLLLSQGTAAWKRPFPAHKIAGNLYCVGTEDLACYLIPTHAGHILINTGLADSAPLLRDSFKQLGFHLEDVKILLTMQAHFDHVAAMREVQKISGAKVLATVADAPILEDGGKSDPYLGKSGEFPPVSVDRRLKDGDIVSLGGTELRVVSTPGHSKGSVSYTMSVNEGGRNLQIAIVNMATVVMPLKGNPKYPNIAEDLERTFAAQKRLSPDIWLAAHASQYGMAAKRKRGSFIDREGYRRAIEDYETSFRQQLRKANGASGI